MVRRTLRKQNRNKQKRRSRKNRNRKNKQNRRRSRNKRSRNNRRNQRAGAYRLNLNDQINGKAVVNPYYRCYNPVMNGGNCRTCGSNLDNFRISKLLKGGNGRLSNFSGNMTQRTFGCRQPEWKPSCV